MVVVVAPDDVDEDDDVESPEVELVEADSL